MIYLIAGPKDGIGKTTTAVNLALYLSKYRKRRVQLVDIGNSAKATELMERAENALDEKLSVIELTMNGLHEKISNFKAEFDDVVIDCAPENSIELALPIADKYIAPFSLSDTILWNVWTLTSLETFVYNAQDSNSKLVAYCFLIGLDDSHPERKNIIEALKGSEIFTYIDSEGYEEEPIDYSIFEFQPKNKQALEKLVAMFKAIGA